MYSQLSWYLLNNYLQDPNQSGFKASNFSEATLLPVTDKLHATAMLKTLSNPFLHQTAVFLLNYNNYIQVLTHSFLA